MKSSKSFYYTVDQTMVDEYKKMLDLMKIPYVIEAPVALLSNGANQYSFVFPNMPGKLYAMVSRLFRGEATPYPQ